MAPVVTFVITGCSGRTNDARTQVDTVILDSGTSDSSDSIIRNKENWMSPDPEKNYLIVEQAVDAWLFYNLSDYKSYEPIIRSTDYDSNRKIYIHHLRYRSMNPEGGIVTSERDFEVDLTKPGENGNPFQVVPIPSSKQN